MLKSIWTELDLMGHLLHYERSIHTALPQKVKNVVIICCFIFLCSLKPELWSGHDHPLYVSMSGNG